MFKKNEIDMLNGPLTGKIILFAIPIAFSGMLQQLFNAADIAIVGRFAGSQCLAAVGATSFVINLLVNLFIGLSIGANVRIAASIGRNDEDGVSKAIHTSIVLSIISGFILLAFAENYARDILMLINTPEDILDMATLYLRVYFGGMPFIMLYNFESAILRSKGDTARPLIVLLVSGIINILLNLFFVIVLKMTVDGVALATVISTAISSLVLFVMLLREKGSFKVYPSRLRIDFQSLKPIVLVGMPAGLQGAMFSFSNVIVQTAMNSLGWMYVAANTTGIYFEYFNFFILNSFTQAAVSFLSQNYAAKNYDRCRKVIRTCTLLTIVSVLVFSVVSIIFAAQICSLFTTDALVIELAVKRVKFILIFQAINGVNEILAGAMRGLGHSLTPAIIVMICVCALRIIWIMFIFPHFNNYESLLILYPVSWALSFTVMTPTFLFLSRRAYGTKQTQLA